MKSGRCTTFSTHTFDTLIRAQRMADKRPGGGRRNFSLVPKQKRARVPRKLQRSLDGLPPLVARCRPNDYATELEHKVMCLRANLASKMGLGGAHCLPEPSVFESPRAHFRNRATFKVWKENTHDAAESLDEPTGGAPDLFFVMFNKDDELRMPLEVPHYPMGSKRLCALMPLVLNELRRSKELSEKVDYCSFMTTLAGPNDEALITLTYNRPLDDQAWSRAAQGMASALGAGIKVVGRSKHRKILVGGETLAEYAACARTREVRLHPGGERLHAAECGRLSIYARLGV